jgi:hypothetical protein
MMIASGRCIQVTKAVPSIRWASLTRVPNARGWRDGFRGCGGEMRKADEMSLWSKIVVVESCWIWTGAMNGHGYGQVNIAGKSNAAHRAFYEFCRGPIPAGLHLDHLCRTPACVNPDHLEPVTPLVNFQRSNAPGRVVQLSGVCRRGHRYTQENTGSNRRGNYCKACEHDRGQRRKEGQSALLFLLGRAGS